jgi:TonB family protein
MLTLSRHLKIALAAALLASAASAFGAGTDVTVPPQARRYMLSMPHPSYPEEARAQRITGRGMCEIVIDPPTGVVTHVVVLQSTHSKILDDAAVKTFLRWRARPGKLSRIRVPFTFTFAR